MNTIPPLTASDAQQLVQAHWDDPNRYLRHVMKDIYTAAAEGENWVSTSVPYANDEARSFILKELANRGFDVQPTPRGAAYSKAMLLKYPDRPVRPEPTLDTATHITVSW